MIEWLAHFGTEHGLGPGDLERFEQLAKPNWMNAAIPAPPTWPPLPDRASTRSAADDRGGVRDRRGGSACAPASDGRGVDPFDLCRQLERDLGEFAERARDRAQRDALEGLTELGDSRVESLPQLLGAAPRSRAGSQLVGELHVASAGTRALGETDEIGVAHAAASCSAALAIGAHALREAEIGRRFVAGLERLAPAHVGELGPVRARRGDLRSRCSVRRRGDGEDVVGDLAGRRCGSRQESRASIRGRPGGLGDVSGRRVEFEGAVEIRPADPPGSPGADGGQPPALDPGPHGRRVELQLIADLGDGQPRIFSRCGGLELGSAIQSLRRRRITISKFVIFDNS